MMISHFRWRLRKAFDSIWAPVIGYALLGLITTFSATALGGYIPKELIEVIGTDSVVPILDIIATSMLTVTTFSASIMVAAYAFASTNATPRAFRLLKRDKVTQRVLAGFLGAFVFSLFGIVEVKAGFYSEGGRVVLFIVSAIVLLLIVVNLMRWIAHLTDFGRMDDTLRRVEDAAASAMKERIENPWLGGQPLDASPPKNGAVITAPVTGYVGHVDLERLSELADDMAQDVYVLALPGTFVHLTANLAVVDGTIPETDDDSDPMHEQISDCFHITEHRDFDQDPRFGLIALSEVGSRALSPGINDPGTAIDVLGRILRVIGKWDDNIEPEVIYPRLHVSSLRASDLMEDGFAAIARDGADMREVCIKLQEMLLALARQNPEIFADAALKQSQRALKLAEKADHLDDDLARLTGLHDTIERIAKEITPKPRAAKV